MSGTSYSNDCIKCGGKGTLMCSSDWKPFDCVSAICVKCGWGYYTKEFQAKDSELEDYQVDYGFNPKTNKFEVVD